MSVRVNIDVNGQEIEFNRPSSIYSNILGSVKPDYPLRFRYAASVLREIADDIDRMYPEIAVTP